MLKHPLVKNSSYNEVYAAQRHKIAQTKIVKPIIHVSLIQTDS